MEEAGNRCTLQKLEDDLRAFWICLGKLGEYGDLGEDFMGAVDSLVFQLQKNVISKVCGIDPSIVTYDYIDTAKTRVETPDGGERLYTDSELVDALEPLITHDLAVKHEKEAKRISEEENQPVDKMTILYDKIATLNERYDKEKLSEEEEAAIEEEAYNACVDTISEITGVNKNNISATLVAYVMRGKYVEEQEGDEIITKVVRFTDVDIKRLSRFIYAFHNIPNQS